MQILATFILFSKYGKMNNNLKVLTNIIWMKLSNTDEANQN